MKNLALYKTKFKLTSESEVFEYFMQSLKSSILLWSYFVNWDKVYSNIQQIEIGLNILNYLIGKDDLHQEFKTLLHKHPEVASIIPALIVRDGRNSLVFDILVDYTNKKFSYTKYNFSKKFLNNADIENYLEFMDKTGLSNLFTSRRIKNLVDYMIGVEAGLDSNGRKNRSGSTMETIVEHFIRDYCKRNSLQYLKQANAKIIKQEFGKEVPVDKSSRKYDFVINRGSTLLIIETNFYSGGGSKLKSTAGEYKGLYNILKNNNLQFVWITDGIGWNASKQALSEAFIHTDYIFNLDMLEHNILDYI